MCSHYEKFCGVGGDGGLLKALDLTGTDADRHAQGLGLHAVWMMKSISSPPFSFSSASPQRHTHGLATTN